MAAWRPAEAVAALPVMEHALVWCMRLWVAETKLGADPMPRIVQVFHDLEVAGGAGCFEKCMEVLAGGMGRLPRVHCLGDRLVGEEEAFFLDLLALQQQGHQATATGLLGCIMRHIPTRKSASAIAGLARVLKRRGLLLERRPAVQQPSWLRCFPSIPLPGSLRPANLC